MQNRKIILIILLWVVAGSFAMAQQKPLQCGNWRFDVKTLTDKGGFVLLNKTPMPTELDRVITQQPPKALNRSSAADGKLPRYPMENDVVEFTAYVTSATISTDDHDFRLVLKSPSSESTMLGESPDPQCPVFNNFPKLREAFTKTGNDIRTVMDLLKKNNMPVKVRITGVTFWDSPGSQQGADPSGLEIHPILKVSVITD